MRIHKLGRLISCWLLAGLILYSPLALAAEGKQKVELKRQIEATSTVQEQKHENKAMLREQQAMLKTIKDDAAQVKELTRSIAQLNGQLQKQLVQVQKNKVRLTPTEVQTLRNHLQVVRTSTQNLSGYEQKYKQAYQQWQKDKQAKQGADRLSELAAVQAAQQQKINQLLVLQQELRQLTQFLSDRR